MTETSPPPLATASIIPVESLIIKAKELRVALDPQLQELKNFQNVLGRGSAGRHVALSVTAMEDVIMRLGMSLKELGAGNPYPNSRDVTNTIVDPTADGLKM